MEFYETIKTRRSIRGFLSDSVPEDALNRILEAGRLAPSWCNRQCWRFLVVKEQSKRNQMADSLGENLAVEAIRQAPIALLVCAEPSDSARYEGKSYYLVDTAIAMEHIMLAATAEGLGTCWIGAFSEYPMRTLFNIPHDIHITGITPLGYPNYTPDAQSRQPLESIIFNEVWKRQ